MALSLLDCEILPPSYPWTFQHGRHLDILPFQLVQEQESVKGPGHPSTTTAPQVKSSFVTPHSTKTFVPLSVAFFFVTLFSETFFLSLCLSVALSFCHSIILRLFVSVTFISAAFSFWDFSSCDSVVKRLFVSVTLSFLDCLFSLSFFLWYVLSATFPFSSLAFCFWLSRFSILVTQKFLK